MLLYQQLLGGELEAEHHVYLAKLGEVSHNLNRLAHHFSFEFYIKTNGF